LSGVAIRVILPGQLAVGLLDLVLRRAVLDAQDFVVITRHVRFSVSVIAFRLWFIIVAPPAATG
jgi:hypothetical protein